MLKKSILSLAGLVYSSAAFAQEAGWEKPITTYATNILGGVQSTVTIVGGVAVIGLLGWGFLAKNPSMYKWAFGGIAIIILAQIGPDIIISLSNISSGS